MNSDASNEEKNVAFRVKTPLESVKNYGIWQNQKLFQIWFEKTSLRDNTN